MAQGLFCSLLIGTIINTIGVQLHISALSQTVATIGGIKYTVGGLAMAMGGPAMACAIGYALAAPPLVLFSLITVGFASNALGGAGGPLAVLFVAIIAAECGKAVSKETKSRYPGYTECDNRHRNRFILVNRSRTRKRSHEDGRYYHVGY